METVVLLGVRRWGEDELTPIAVDHRRTCGTSTDLYPPEMPVPAEEGTAA